ncbi:MAG: hypothetical protein KAH18_07570 [Psychromonas sp.]|nr:hypothetical protein [Psychromonas sp.]
MKRKYLFKISYLTSQLGNVHNANTDVIMKLERINSFITWSVYSIAEIKNYKLEIKSKTGHLFHCLLTLMPGETRTEILDTPTKEKLTICITSADKRTFLEYTEHETSNEDPTPEPATAPESPENIESVEELFFIGQHLQQYHHATRDPINYYQEALKRDPQHYQCNLAMGTLAYESADYHAAISYTNLALARAHKLNKNPICGKASFLRGCAKEKLCQLGEAFADIFKSTWSGNFQDIGFYGLAKICTQKNNLSEALEYVERALQLNSMHYHAAILKSYLLIHLKMKNDAISFIDDQNNKQPLNYALAFHKYLLTQTADDLKTFKELMNHRETNTIHIANFYLSIGDKSTVNILLKHCDSEGPMTHIYKAYLLDEPDQIKVLLNCAEKTSNKNVLFPNTLIELIILESFVVHEFTLYLLGCFFYSKKNYARAISLWEKALLVNHNYATVLRNLSVYTFNKIGNINKSLYLMELAFTQSPADARILF